jgi:hypothetical protein
LTSRSGGGSGGSCWHKLPPVGFIDSVDGFVVLDLIGGPDAFDLVIEDEALAAENDPKNAVTHPEVKIFHDKNAEFILGKAESLEGVVFSDGVVLAIATDSS